MLLRTSAFTLDYSTWTDFLIKGQVFEMLVERPEGQPFWMFSRDRSEVATEVWGLGFYVVVCRIRTPSADDLPKDFAENL